MEHTGIELLLGRQMPHTGDERLPERPIIGPFGEDAVHGRVVNDWLPIDVMRHRQAFPLHPGVEHPQDEVKDPVIAEFALGTALRHRKVWQDKCRELWFGELDRNRCRCWLLCRYAHHAMASWEEGEGDLEKRITSDTTRGWGHLQNSQPVNIYNELPAEQVYPLPPAIVQKLGMS